MIIEIPESIEKTYKFDYLRIREKAKSNRYMSSI